MSISIIPGLYVYVVEITAGSGPVLQENFERAQVPSTNPWQIQTSGYNRLEEWLHAQAKLVEN